MLHSSGYHCMNQSFFISFPFPRLNRLYGRGLCDHARTSSSEILRVSFGRWVVIDKVTRLGRTPMRCRASSYQPVKWWVPLASGLVQCSPFLATQLSQYQIPIRASTQDCQMSICHLLKLEERNLLIGSSPGANLTSLTVPLCPGNL